MCRMRSLARRKEAQDQIAASRLRIIHFIMKKEETTL